LNFVLDFKEKHIRSKTGSLSDPTKPLLTKGRRGGVKEGNKDGLCMRQEIGAYGLVRQEKRLV